MQTVHAINRIQGNKRFPMQATIVLRNFATWRFSLPNCAFFSPNVGAAQDSLFGDWFWDTFFSWSSCWIMRSIQFMGKRSWFVSKLVETQTWDCAHGKMGLDRILWPTIVRTVHYEIHNMSCIGELCAFTCKRIQKGRMMVVTTSLGDDRVACMNFFSRCILYAVRQRWIQKLFLGFGYNSVLVRESCMPTVVTKDHSHGKRSNNTLGLTLSKKFRLLFHRRNHPSSMIQSRSEVRSDYVMFRSISYCWWTEVFRYGSLTAGTLKIQF